MKASWKAILATLGVVLPAVFTFLASRADSNEAKIRAEVAYVTLQDSVKELQEASYEQALELAEIKGQLKVEKREHAEIHKSGTHFIGPMAVPHRPPDAEDSVDGDGIEDAPAPVQVKLKAPPAFNEAVNSYKAKK